MPQMNLKFGRVITAMVTPFKENGDVDFDEAVKLAHYLVDTGTDTVLLAGTTGESPTLTHDEEFELFRVVKQSLGNRSMVMAGTGSNCTRTAVEATLEAEKLGLDATLQVVPYYNKPSQEGMYQHFKAVARASSLPILLYNIPGRTGVNMLPETVARLAELPTIFGIKEASGRVEQVKEIREITSNDFLIYSGDDALTLEFMNEGACGVVSVASHIEGANIQEMVRAFERGERELAFQIHNQLEDLFKVLFITSNPSPVKAALNYKGFKVGQPRLPLVSVTTAEAKQIEDVLFALKTNK